MEKSGAQFRQEMLDLAVRSAAPGDDPRNVMHRAGQYADFVLGQSMSTCVLRPWEWQNAVVNFGPTPKAA